MRWVKFVSMRKLLLVFSLFIFSMSFGQTCIFYIDADMDGYGDDFSFTESPCDIVPPGTTLNPGDCDDFDPTVNPSAIEICNYIDDNCNGGEVDEFVQLNFYQDMDLDGYGDANFLVLECFEQPGFVSNMEDCDDNLVTYQDVDAEGWVEVAVEVAVTEISRQVTKRSATSLRIN